MTSQSEAETRPTADYIARDWQRYQGLEYLVDHWDRPGWANGRRSYHWLLTFDDSPELNALAARCQAQLQDVPTLDLVPLTSLHVTLQRAGFTDEISRVEAEAIAKSARSRCAALQSFKLHVGPLAGSTGAVRFSAGPHEPVCKVRQAVQAAIADVRGKDAVPDGADEFIPHVSIAYSNAATSAAPVIARVAALRSLGAVPVQVDEVLLVELRREGRSYEWASMASVALGEQTL